MNQQFVPLPLVSVILAVRNEAAHLPRCLMALARQTYPSERLELLIVDGGSTDSSVAIARAFTRNWATASLLDNAARLTPAGFNTGIRAARGDVIVILGARAAITPDFITESVAALARTGADAVGGVVESRPAGDGSAVVAGAVALALRSPFGVGDARYRYTTVEQETDTVNYGAYRRDVFERIGLFDETLQWVEDDEFNYRLRAAGGRLVVSPRIKVVYQPRASLAALGRQQFRWGLNKPKVARRHPAQMRPRHAVPALFVATVALSAGGAPLFRPARRLLAAVLTAYALAAALAALLAVRRSPPRAVPKGAGPVARDEGRHLRSASAGAVLVASGKTPPVGTWPSAAPNLPSDAPTADRRAVGGQRWRRTLVLPVVFATMHIAYGGGMLIGLLTMISRGGSRAAGERR